MSSDDYESIDSPRVTSLSDLARLPPQQQQSHYSKDNNADVTPTASSSNSASKNVVLQPLQPVFLYQNSESSDLEKPRVQLREKKNTARAQDATVSHFMGDEAPGQKFKRRTAERHSMLADFASRRSPFHLNGTGSGRWTDLFSSSKRKTREKLNVRKDDSRLNKNPFK